MDNPLFPKAPLIHCLPLVRRKISHHPVRLPPPSSVVFRRRCGFLCTAFAVCVSFSGFETKLWLAALWDPAERRFPRALVGRDTCWSGTPSPAPAAECWCTPFWVGELPHCHHQKSRASLWRDYSIKHYWYATNYNSCFFYNGAVGLKADPANLSNILRFSGSINCLWEWSHGTWIICVLIPYARIYWCVCCECGEVRVKINEHASCRVE